MRDVELSSYSILSRSYGVADDATPLTRVAPACATYERQPTMSSSDTTAETTQEHILKTLPTYWNAVSSGVKNFEVRRDDRGFQKGDILILRCWDHVANLWVLDSYAIGAKHKDVRKRISYILTGGQLGIEAGYVVMGLSDDV